MPDPNIVTTHNSWFSRLGASFRGVVTGLILALAGIVLLFWNEGRSVDAIRANAEGAANVVAVNANRIDPANEGRLVHVSAPALAEGVRQDMALGISSDALILARKVEYYQWQQTAKSETRTKLGGGEETTTAYSYAREWSDFAQDSSGFHQPAGHENPAPTLKNESFSAEHGKVGAFGVDAAVLNGLSADHPFQITTEQAEIATKALSRPASVTEGRLYIGDNPAEPKVGDMKISYVTAPQGMAVSIIGGQTRGTIQPYPTKAGAQILMVRAGTASAEQMFAQAKSANRTTAWVLRAIGFVVLVAGFKMVLGPLGVLADVLPLLGSIVRMGTGFIAMVSGLALGTLTIAIAWLFYRPLLAVALFVLIGAGIYGAIWWRRRRTASATPPLASPAA